jgi:hypothetical protein
MIHHILVHNPDGDGVEDTIATDTNTIVMDGDSGDYSGYCAIDVTPNTMTTSLAKVDSGDGTAWATLSTSGDTSDYSFRAQADSDNTTGSTRSMTIRITDDAGEATQVDITLTQQIQVV